jgi:hypothetical protein
VDLEISFQLRPEEWGNGYAAEAAAALIQWAFTQNVDELFAVAIPNNTRAIATTQRWAWSKSVRPPSMLAALPLPEPPNGANRPPATRTTRVMTESVFSGAPGVARMSWRTTSPTGAPLP